MDHSYPLFLEDAYLTTATATVIAVEDNRVLLDKTIFYPTGGGQPGDWGDISLASGTSWHVNDTVRDPANYDHIWHIGAAPAPFRVGDSVTAAIDWERRYAHMRMHSCLHLLCSLISAPVTGCGIAVDKGRLDFDLPENTLSKEDLSAQLNHLVDEDLSIIANTISANELKTSPNLVRTASVSPPVTGDTVRLISVAGIDRQPCGGTHVRSTTEIGPVLIAKIEKKSRLCRRVVVAFGATNG